MEKVIHIVEPTLEGESGHCHSFVESLCRAREAGGPVLWVWAGRRARLPRMEAAGATVRPHFHRRIRRFQEYFLLAKLLAGPGRIFISTAGRSDLVLLDLAARAEIPPGKVFLYFHWVRPTPSKEDRLRKVASRHPHLAILAPTGSVAEVLLRSGFRETRVVPYPVAPASDATAPSGFRHLLYAGAARQDKGFSAVVDLVVHMAELGLDVPVLVQASADHYEKYDTATRSDLARLAAVRSPDLCLLRESLDSAAYAGLFRGAICLQPYDRGDFRDRISGVTLDALSGGCPVVATSGTWIARVVDRFGAGRTVDGLDPQSLLAAVEEIRGDYDRLRDNAFRAGLALREENSARHLLAVLTGD